MTQQLTEKSDVYSFGVVMLELLTGRRPIERGKYVVREVKMALDRAKHLYNFGELLDSSIGLDTTLKGLDKFVDVALKCVLENGSDRPTMGEWGLPSFKGRATMSENRILGMSLA
ncbi:hypothetical protein DKX38_001717 [Salix brachista]|uniref:Protein kinase domain-containing protein n=1 Tax=Salix brachista TaxID=2182728 RepID=A0A5N5P6H7_9ROSI|nr:hypothetical protein DKX38_001717 [Salix brachista]